MSGHSTAFRENIYALRAVIKGQRAEIEAIQKNGGYPADYSLGFINALIFIEHRFSHRAGNPTFYNHKTTIGVLPKPVPLTGDGTLEDTAPVPVEPQPTPGVADLGLYREFVGALNWLNAQESEEAQSLRDLVRRLQAQVKTSPEPVGNDGDFGNGILE